MGGILKKGIVNDVWLRQDKQSEQTEIREDFLQSDFCFKPSFECDKASHLFLGLVSKKERTPLTVLPT